ncbi:TPA: EpsG family protein [Photobacterium damselae]
MLCFAFFNTNERLLFKVNIFILSFYSSVVYSSRSFFEIYSDDYIRYFEVYKESVFSWYSLYFKEPGLLIFYNLINGLGFNLSVNGLVFLTNFVICSLIGIFFYRLFITEQLVKYPGLCLSISSLIISFEYINQLVRQSFSLAIVLFMLLSISKWRKIVIYICASCFHFSTIIVAPIIIWIKNKSIFSSILMLAIGIVVFYFFVQIGVIHISEHFIYYTRTAFEISWYVKYIIVIYMVSVFMYIANISYLQINDKEKDWFRFLSFLSFLLLIISPFGLISLRVFLFYILFFIGFHCYLSLRNKFIIIFFIAILFSVKFFKIVIMPYNVADPFSLWGSFEQYSYMPFYYFSEY